MVRRTQLGLGAAAERLAEVPERADPMKRSPDVSLSTNIAVAQLCPWPDLEGSLHTGGRVSPARS
jgi:hypothetical protein